ncbi:MAG: hypothetical protein Q4D23_09590 [Bacteroidales bacterium]|nr:hypothetical protein [Bacteroidales bacterium]
MPTTTQIAQNQLILTFENASIMSAVKKMLSFMQGVTVTTPRKKKLNGVDQALLDIKEGRVYHAESLDDLFNQLDA